jgi:hypothetical protein
VAGKTAYLDIKLSNTGAIAREKLVYFERTLPGLIFNAVPKDYQAYAKFVEIITIGQDFDRGTKTTNLQIFFPLVPEAAHDKILELFQKYVVPNEEVKQVLSSVLPTFLGCGDCQFDGITVDILDPTKPVVTSLSPTGQPPTRPQLERHEVGLALKMVNYKKMTPEDVENLQKTLPGLLSSVLSQSSLSDKVKAILTRFMKTVQIEQNCGANVLDCAVVLLFPSVPSLYVELYKPLVQQYIADNQDVFNQAKPIIPGLLKCAPTCSVSNWKVFDRKIQPPTASPTANPTAAPTVPPTTAAAGGGGDDSGNSASALHPGAAALGAAALLLAF